MNNFKFYKDKSGKHRWRRVADNGKIIGASSQGYVNKKECRENAVLNGCK